MDQEILVPTVPKSLRLPDVKESPPRKRGRLGRESPPRKRDRLGRESVDSFFKKIMPDLNYFKEEKAYYTGKLSDISRSLAFAGIAIIWIFRIGTGTDTKFPEDLIYPAVFLVATLFLDLLHYSYSAIAWSLFYHFKQSALGADSKENVISPLSLVGIGYFLFIAKVFSIFMAYYFLLRFIWQNLKFS